MGAHELMCWNYLLTEPAKANRAGALVMSVDDEIAAWK